jgi:hypothetical protein
MDKYSLRFCRGPPKNGSRANTVGIIEIVNRERAERETEFPSCVINHPEKLLYVRLSVEKGGNLAALRESGLMAGSPPGRELERDTLPRLRKDRDKSDVKRRRYPVCFSAFTCVL